MKSCVANEQRSELAYDWHLYDRLLVSCFLQSFWLSQRTYPVECFIFARQSYRTSVEQVRWYFTGCKPFYEAESHVLIPLFKKTFLYCTEPYLGTVWLRRYQVSVINSKPARYIACCSAVQHLKIKVVYNLVFLLNFT